MFRLSTRLNSSGEFELRATLPDDTERRCIAERVDGALRLLEAYAPGRYADLRRDLPRILVGASHGVGECHDSVGICLLKFDFVVADDTDPVSIALTLVHEGMHARLTRAGFPYNSEVRGRVERICAKAELLLASRIPGGEARAEYARARSGWADAMWSDQAYAERRRRALEEIGWAGRVAYRLSAQWADLRRLLSRRAA